MKTKKSTRNNRLEEAIALLLQTQAVQNQNQATLLAHLADVEREAAVRFARIAEILQEHTHILETLPEAIKAIRDKIGFRPTEP